MTITNEHLSDIESAFTPAVLKEIIAQYKANNAKPSLEACAALARVYGKSAGEIEAIFMTSRSSAQR